MSRVDPLSELRALTGAGLQACKRVLAASQGSVQKAARRLRRSGEAPSYRSKKRQSSIDPHVALRGYRFDAWAEAIASGIDRQVPSATAAIEIALDELALWPVQVLHAGTELDPYQGWDVGAFAIPDSFDEEDLALELFFDAQLDNPALVIEAFSLGDYFVLPGLLWRAALHQIAHRVGELAVARGAPRPVCFVRIHDEVLDPGEEATLWAWARREVTAHLADEDLLLAFSRLVYETAAMRDRLTRV